MTVAPAPPDDLGRRRPPARWPATLRRTGAFALSVALTFLGLIFITFVIGRVIPIDPVLVIVGDRALPEVYERVKREMGLDLPLYHQFWLYLLAVVHGELGTSVESGRPVLYDLGRYFPATFELATAATILGAGLGVPLGVLAATRHGRWPDHAIRVVTLVGYSVPVFWLGLVGLLVFYARLGWVSGPGRIDVAYQYAIQPSTGLMLVDTLLAGDVRAFGSAVSHLVLPASILGYFSMAYVGRMTRSLMLEQLGQEYVLTAQVKGLPARQVVWGHAFVNVRVPLLTVVVLSYGYLLEGAVLTETVFAWPGLGRYITQALFSADINAVLGGTMVVGACFVGLNLLSDLLYGLLDVRARPQ